MLASDGFPRQSITDILGHAVEADIIIPVVTNRGALSLQRGLLPCSIGRSGSTFYNGAVVQRNELLRAIEITTNSFAYQAEGWSNS